MIPRHEYNVVSLLSFHGLLQETLYLDLATTDTMRLVPVVPLLDQSTILKSHRCRALQLAPAAAPELCDQTLSFADRQALRDRFNVLDFANDLKVHSRSASGDEAPDQCVAQTALAMSRERRGPSAFRATKPMRADCRLQRRVARQESLIC